LVLFQCPGQGKNWFRFCRAIHSFGGTQDPKVLLAPISALAPFSDDHGVAVENRCKWSEVFLK